jgi:hypothetical protein
VIAEHRNIALWQRVALEMSPAAVSVEFNQRNLPFPSCLKDLEFEFLATCVLYK